jgi:peptidoglycan/xylan/chitin deacetylase (PgdA/CDA1 family)
MEQYTLRFNKVDPNKTSVCFTWDDNFLRHIKYIAPAFSERDLRCTFYINPGEEDFEQKQLPGYMGLSKQGFEIGSHGYLHENLCTLPYASSVDIVKNAIASIQKLFGFYPTTFAFPYHDFDEEMLSMVKSYHLETRNTLLNSKRFGIKTDSSLESMRSAIRASIDGKHTLVFSGHSIILSADEATDDALKSETGYNPILLDHLNCLLDFIRSKNQHIEVLTFKQAALKEYIKTHCDITGQSFTIAQKQLDRLKPYHIECEELARLM